VSPSPSFLPGAAAPIGRPGVRESNTAAATTPSLSSGAPPGPVIALSLAVRLR
jgi:hypothetical protein